MSVMLLSSKSPPPLFKVCACAPFILLTFLLPNIVSSLRLVTVGILSGDGKGVSGEQYDKFHMKRSRNVKYIDCQITAKILGFEVRLDHKSRVIIAGIIQWNHAGGMPYINDIIYDIDGHVLEEQKFQEVEEVQKWIVNYRNQGGHASPRQVKIGILSGNGYGVSCDTYDEFHRTRQETLEKMMRRNKRKQKKLELEQDDRRRKDARKVQILQDGIRRHAELSKEVSCKSENTEEGIPKNSEAEEIPKNSEEIPEKEIPDEKKSSNVSKNMHGSLVMDVEVIDLCSSDED